VESYADAPKVQNMQKLRTNHTADEKKNIVEKALALGKVNKNIA
jgi:hypothetical protein